MPLVLFPRCAITALCIKDATSHEKIDDLLLQAVVSFRRTLLHLDVSGLADIALPVLLRVEPEQLQLLRAGDCMDSRTPDDSRHNWPEGVRIDMVGKACPSLTALDVGFSSIDGGVQIPHLHQLCKGGGGRFRHLDLSQVMTYCDFDGGITVLSKFAPELESLAVYGLHVSDAALESLAQLRRLTTVHLVACSNYTAGGLASFLSMAPDSLRNLDLSFGLAPVDALQEWLHGRSPLARPVRITLIEAYHLSAAPPTRQLLMTEHFELLLAAGAAMLVAIRGAMWKGDTPDKVATCVERAHPVLALYNEDARQAWVELQKHYGLRIMDALAEGG